MMPLRLLSILFAVFLFQAPAIAQSGENDPQNSLLPEINPQDIEIRSEFQARFPGLRRQPILGFNPKPRVYQIDPNRLPFLESREDAVAGIEITELDRPDPPVRNLMNTPQRIKAYLRGGVGSYSTPEAEAYGFSKIGSKSLVSTHVNYRSSAGHLDDQDSGFRYLDANVDYISKLREDIKLTVEAGAISDFNHLFNLENTILQNNIGKTSEKDYTGGGGSIIFEKIDNSLEGWRIAAGGNVFAVNLDAGSSNLSGDVNEQVFHSEISKYWAGRKMYETFDITAHAEGGMYQSSSFDDQQWLKAGGAVKYSRLFNYSTHVSAKGGVEYVSDGISEKVYVVPQVDLKHNLKDAVIITGSAYAKPVIQSVQEHHQNNRLLNHETQIRHSYQVGARGEIAFQPFEGNRIFGGLGYDYIRDFAYYQRDAIPSMGGNARYTFYDVSYGNASILELFGGITQQLVPEKFWFDVKFFGRSPSLTSGGDIPYEERLGLEGAVAYKPFNKLTVNAWAEYIGEREDPAAPEKLDPFALVNGSAEFQMNERFGVYIKLLNILGQEYELWNGYRERPFQVFGGLTIKI